MGIYQKKNIDSPQRDFFFFFFLPESTDNIAQMRMALISSVESGTLEEEKTLQSKPVRDRI